MAMSDEDDIDVLRRRISNACAADAGGPHDGLPARQVRGRDLPALVVVVQHEHREIASNETNGSSSAESVRDTN